MSTATNVAGRPVQGLLGDTVVPPLPDTLRDTVADLEKHNGTEFCVLYVPDAEFDNLFSGFSAEFSSAIKPDRGSVRLRG